MSAFTPKLDENYRRYAELLLQYHRLLSGGEAESEQTSAVEHEMSELWQQLDERQRSSLSGLGSDLNWVRRKGAPPPRGRKQTDVKSADLDGLRNSQESLDWHAVLHFARLCAPRLELLEQANVRALAWEKAGLPQVSKVFREFRAELEASNGLANPVDEALPKAMRR